MNANVKKAFAQIAFQIAASLIEHEIKSKLKEKGINPADFERMLRDILESAQKSHNIRPPLKGGPMTVEKAFNELGLSSNATPYEIKTKFRKLVLENHTDRTQDPATEIKLRKVIEAYNKLKEAGRVK
jgi:DnaJ-domain-containing protein 1